MRIGLLGVTGGVGGIFAELALDAGHDVVALARTPSKVTLKHKRLIVVQGDSTSKDAVEKVVRGSTVVRGKH